MIPFNYHHLYYFYIVAQENSISKAAIRLRIAQPTLSVQLKQFERFLGIALFNREGRKLILTEKGAYILTYAKSIFDLGQELSDSLSDRSQKGRIKVQIGMTSLIPKTFVSFLFKFILTNRPKTYINLIESNLPSLIEQLKTHELDFILNDLTYQAPQEEGIENHLIGKIPIVFCANKKLAKKYRNIPVDLNEAPLYLPTAQSQTYHALQEYFLENKVKPNVMGEIQNVELVRQLVLEGHGIALLNQLTINETPSPKDLFILKTVKKLNINVPIYLISKKRKNPHPLLNIILKNFDLKL